MKYTTEEILDILWEHELRRTITINKEENSATIPTGTQERVAERFNNWFEGEKHELHH